MVEEEDFDCLVIGAGISGLDAALAPARQLSRLRRARRLLARVGPRDQPLRGAALPPVDLADHGQTRLTGDRPAPARARAAGAALVNPLEDLF